MHNWLIFVFLLPFAALSQSGTEVYLFDLVVNENGYSVSNPRNISNNPGYDNQPSFLRNQPSILFSHTREGQTDVARYDIETEKLTILTQTPGSEYSPQQMPDETYFSAILLEKDGTQLLNSYPIEGGNPRILVPDLVIGYHAWQDANQLFAFVLGNPSTLQHIRLKEGINVTVIIENPGRALQFFKEEKKLYYADKSDSIAAIMSYDPDSKQKTKVIELSKGSEDFVVFPDGKLVVGAGSKLFMYNPKKSDSWIVFADLGKYGLTGISRLAVSVDRKFLAVVVEE